MLSLLQAAGDLVLTKVAAAMKKEIRELDILAIENTEISGSDFPEIKITVSIGVKCLEGEQTLDELINNADKKLYEAKKEGKNLVRT